MERITMEKLSDCLRISKTTVSKALNDCPGIRYETKEKILKIARECGYETEKASVRIGIVLPSNPGYFWEEARKELGKASRSIAMGCSAFVYSDLGHEKDAEECIERAARTGISVMIIAAPDTERIRKKLQELAEHMLVLLFEEFLEVKNAFFIGEDHYKSGYDLGRRYSEIYPEHKRVLIVKQSVHQASRRRVEGFLAAMEKSGVQPCGELEFLGRDHAFSAVIARRLAEIEIEFDCVFCPSGFIPYLCQALQKLKLKQRIHCIGYENPDSNRMYFEMGMLKMVMKQNLTAQAEAAMCAADRYVRRGLFPQTKFVYIESSLIEA